MHESDIWLAMMNLIYHKLIKGKDVNCIWVYSKGIVRVESERRKSRLREIITLQRRLYFVGCLVKSEITIVKSCVIIYYISWNFSEDLVLALLVRLTSSLKFCIADNIFHSDIMWRGEIIKINWQLLKIFCRNTGPVSTKIGTKHPWVKGIQVCSNEQRPRPYQGEVITK